MDMRDVFDKVKAHLLKQNAQSVVGGVCAYRGYNGMMCAVGCLIEDEVYYPDMNSESIGSVHVVEALQKSGIDVHYGTKMFSMLTDLQYMHDHNSVESWPILLDEVEANYFP